MATTVSEESGVGMSMDTQSCGQPRCQSGEALAEWRSSEQVENGTPSTSPPYWDSDDDEDGGPKPSDLYGKYTWKIDKFSQINKRELRSNAFEVGGYKWYILIYPQGCDVCNHLSLFLCVANHDKLLPGWSHFAQFTIAVVNKDPKKSKYSDTLHRFWKKEHDWGWKKFMELSKVLDGFIDADTLIIKAQVQVIREKSDRPFRCLDCQYRRELVRVYLSNVEQICRRFVEERRGKLGKLIEDKARWSSFCAFWLGMDQNARRRMSREKTDSVLKIVVKHFFVEKEVTSTLVMDSLYSGLKALEGQCKAKKGKGKHLDVEELPVPIVRMEKDMFVLVDDVLLLLERAAMEPLPPKDEKGPQNRTKDGGSGEDFNKDSIERDERRLTELGRRTIEIFVLSQIFSKIEVAYQEAVALKRQEELIREEAAWLAETEQKAKRGGPEKEKKSKKKQGKQKRNNRKAKDKGRDEKPGNLGQDKSEQESLTGERINYLAEAEVVVEKLDAIGEVSDVSDTVDCVPEVLQPDSEDRDVSPVNWYTDITEFHPPIETSSSASNGSSSVQNGSTRRTPSIMDDSSSTCSTDSVPPVGMNGHKGNQTNHKKQKSPSRRRNQRSKATCDAADWTSEMHGQSFEAASDAGQTNDASLNGVTAESESHATDIKQHEHVVKKDDGALLQTNLGVKDEDDLGIPSLEKKISVSSPPRSPPMNLASPVQLKSDLKINVASSSVLIKKLSLESPRPRDSPARLVNPAEISMMSRSDAHKAAAPRSLDSTSGQHMVMPEKPLTQQATVTTEKTSHHAPVMSRPLSAPLIPGPRPAAPVVTMVQTTPLLARSVSAAGRLGPDPSPATHSYVPQSYRNVMMGSPVTGSSAGFSQPHSPSSAVGSSHSYSQASTLVAGPLYLSQGSERMEPNSVRPSFSFGMVHHDSLQNGPQWVECPPRDSTRSMSSDNTSLLNDIGKFAMYKPVNSRSHDHLSSEFAAGTSGRQTHNGLLADEFPHLDIINDLLDDEHGIGKCTTASPNFQVFGNGPHHLNRQFTFPGDIGTSADLGSLSSCRFERTRSYQGDGLQPGYSGGLFDPVREISQSIPRVYANGQIDASIPSQWQILGSDPSFLSTRTADSEGYQFQIPEFSNLPRVNGYTVFRPSNGP